MGTQAMNCNTIAAAAAGIKVNKIAAHALCMHACMNACMHSDVCFSRPTKVTQERSLKRDKGSLCSLWNLIIT